MIPDSLSLIDEKSDSTKINTASETVLEATGCGKFVGNGWVKISCKMTYKEFQDFQILCCQ
jgi:hypothetical protein